LKENVPNQFQDRFRKIAARLRIVNERPVFTEFPAQETTRTYTQFCQYLIPETPGVNPGYVYQYGLAAGDQNVYVASFGLHLGFTEIPRGFGTSGLFVSDGTNPTEYYRALTVASDGTLYGAYKGKVYKRVWVDKVGYQCNLIIALTDQNTTVEPEISIVAILPTHVVVAAVYANNDVQDLCKISIINDSGGIDTWKGYLPKHKHRPNLAAVRTSDGTIHIYVDDWSGKKPVYLRRFDSKIWSATTEILPMDALDEDSSFSVGYSSILSNGRVFLTGVVKRKYGTPYSIYMLGPDKFTYGRDLIIMSDYGKPLMLAESEGHIWAVGQDDIFHSPLTPGIFSAASPTAQADVFRASIDLQTNAADRLSLEVPVSELATNADELVPGAMLDLDVLANDQSFTIGRFGVDRFRLITGSEGQNFQVDCSSYALKKLMDWESDTYFDYMGQGESHGDPGDLTKLVRLSGGTYNTPEGGGLELKSLNEDGMLYTTVPSSQGGFIRAKFTNVQATDAMLGVGLNYGEETMAEAAVRLNKKVEQVTAADRGRWVLLAMYVPDSLGAPAGQARVALYDYNTLRRGNMESPTAVNPWRFIGSTFVTKAPSTVTLALQYQDGYARVYYTGTNTSDLSLAVSAETKLQWEVHPTEHENYGRGMIYMRNNTGYHMSYPFMSDSDVIPLYDGVAKAEKYGYALEDRTDKFPASNGSVLVDSERITYSGIAGWDEHKRVITDLEWVPGRVLCKAGDGVSLPTGTPTDFARSRGTTSGSHVHGNNYFLQVIPASAYSGGAYVTALRIWLKKVNYPEDGVTLTINAGNVGSSNAAVALVNNVLAYGSIAPGSKISAEGGWVTYYFDTYYLSHGTEYWIMIRRNKNWNHPSSSAYFQFMKMHDNTLLNAGVYVFCEEDDAAVGQSGDAAFVLYGRVEGINKEALVTVKYDANSGLSQAAASTYWSGGTPTASQNWWNGCALVVTDGAGKNNCYRIVRSYRYTDSLNDLFVYALDRDPGRIFDLGTKMRSVPAMYGLKRGQNGYDNKPTAAAAHGDLSKVHFPKNTFAKSTYFEYYSAEEDLTLAEVAEAIARKAGVVETDLSNRHTGTVAGHIPTVPLTLENVPAQSKNSIVSLNLPYMGGDQDVAAVIYRDTDNIPVYAVQFVIGMSGVTRFGFVEFLAYQRIMENGQPAADAYSILKVPFDENVQGDFRVSLYDGHLSAWVGGRVLAGVNIDQGIAWLNSWIGFNITRREWVNVAVDLQMDTPNGAVAKVLIPQAGTRVDNFVMDMGKTGAQLLSGLVGEKRIFFRDDGTGKLKIYTDRETVPGSYNRAISVTKETTDIGLATRVLLEGGEVVEVSSTGNLQQYGNFFKTFNFNEINNLDDAAYFADLVLSDMSLNRERVEVEGAADPRIEPTDIITISFPEGGTRQAVVDGISHTLFVDESDAAYDMRLSGRFKE